MILVPERRSFLGTGGVRLAADRWPAVGAERGTVLLLHGGGQTRHSWDAAAADLAKLGWTAVTLDLRGHGESEWDPERRYSIDVQGADFVAVAAAIEREGGGRPVLIGASMGGLASLMAVGEAPERFRGLVLVDIALRTEPEGVARIRAFMTEKPEGYESLEEAAAAVAAYNPARSRPVRPEGLRKNMRMTEAGRWRWHWDPEILNQEHDSTDPQHPLRRQLREGAERARLPTLLVRGLRSDVVSAEGIEEAKALLPNASVAEVSDAAHMIAGDDNSTFLEAIGEFLEGLEKR